MGRPFDHRTKENGENEALARLSQILPPAPSGEVWAGDDAAVLQVPGSDRLLLLAEDTVVGGLDADFALTNLADLGWRALTVNLSDIAAMGGRPGHAVVSVVGLGLSGLDELYTGLLQAAGEYGCPVVGGDLSGGQEVVVTVAVTGWVEGHPVLRSGARPGDCVWVTEPLGAAAAGLRLLREHGPGARSDLGALESQLVEAHARPRPALAEGDTARTAGATAMIDVSDGFALDMTRLAHSSGVGVELDELPVADGATPEEALGGGDDYALIFTGPAEMGPAQAFAAAGLTAPLYLGRCVGDPSHLCLAGSPLPEGGWEHSF